MKLRIAIQKSGRLHDDSIKLLKECGIDINNGVNKLKTEASNFPLEVFFLRDDDAFHLIRFHIIFPQSSKSEGR